VQIDGLAEQDLGADRTEGEHHHGKVTRADAGGRHRDDVHDAGGAYEDEDDGVDGVFPLLRE
jgi:hypothetical protein